MAAGAIRAPHAARERPLPPRLLGDARLANLAAAGDLHAFEAIYKRHHQALYRYARSIVRIDDDAQDVLQSSMERALAALRRDDRSVDLRPWLFRIVHNEAISLLRRRAPAASLDDAPEVAAQSVEAQVAAHDALATLVADLQQLSERQRAALVMRELSGLSHEEIASALSISVAAAKDTIFQARSAMRAFAGGRGMSCEDVTRAISDRDGRQLRGRRLRAHLRTCAACRDFRDAISSRQEGLAALAPPLPAAAAATLLTRLLAGAGTHSHAGGSLGGALGLKGSGALALKAIAATAIAAGVGLGVAKVVAPAHPHHPLPGHSTTRHAPAVGPAPATQPSVAQSTAPYVHRHGRPRTGNRHPGANGIGSGRWPYRTLSGGRADGAPLGGSRSGTSSVGGHGRSLNRGGAGGRGHAGRGNGRAYGRSRGGGGSRSRAGRGHSEGSHPGRGRGQAGKGGSRRGSGNNTRGSRGNGRGPGGNGSGGRSSEPSTGSGGGGQPSASGNGSGQGSPSRGQGHQGPGSRPPGQSKPVANSPGGASPGGQAGPGATDPGSNNGQQGPPGQSKH